MIAALAASCAGLGLSTQALAQESLPDAPVAAASEAESGAPALRTGTSPQIVLAPIPQSNPTLGSGLTLVGMVLYTPEGSERAWTTGAAGMYTDSQSWGVGVFQKAYLMDDRLRVTAAAGYGRFNIDFYGVGGDAGSRDRYVQLEQRAGVGLGQALWGVQPELFLGPRLQVISLTSTLRTPPIPDLGIDPAELSVHGTSVSLGPSLEYDTRDSEYGTRSGVYATADWMFAGEAIGSDFHYSKGQFAANYYRPAGDNAVLAARAYACSASDAPFFDLCLYGSHNDLRGYAGGQYRDTAMGTAQVEYRRHLFGRFGMVLFGGAGFVSPGWSDLNEATFLPAAGAGLRVEVSKEYHLNLSVDAAVGRESTGLYLYIGEAF